MTTIRQLASRLACIARQIRETHGDLLAQTVPYALLVRRWDQSAQLEPLLSGFGDCDCIASIEEVLDCLDLDSLRALYEADGKNPSIYFYEDFLRAYDPASSRGRGVLYTPPEIVDCMVRGVETILRDSFGQLLDGALVVDPCCGVGTFLRHVEHHTPHRPKMLGMELMPAPHAIARCLVREAEIVQADWLSQVPLDTEGRTLVILGNPPYSGHSSNAGKIADLMADYRDGLDERNPKWLQDDYVKFIRMAQHQVESSARGIVALITNHSFLFNPTFRAMRASLARTFDEALVLDLGGNVKRLDTANGNVFPIQMGVAISFFVKTSGNPECNVRYASIEGTRQEKLNALSSLTLRSTPWEDVRVAQPFHLFTPHDGDLSSEFYGFPSLFDIFTESTVGFVTSRDAYAIGFTREEVLDRIAALRDGNVRGEDAVGDLDIESARQQSLDDPHWREKAIEVLYRPFDRRWAYYSRAVMERPRLPFMENLMRENVALAVGRAGQVTGSREWDVVFCTDRPADLNLFRRGGAKLFPRWVYRGDVRHSNMQTDVLDPDALFGYIYALLHSTAYRVRYAALLGIDYPRIPIPEDQSVLTSLAALGNELLRVHLLADCPASTHASEEAASIQIGGYEVPAKCIKERGHIDSPEQIAQVIHAVERTHSIRAQTDEIIARTPPWEHTQGGGVSLSTHTARAEATTPPHR